MFKALALALPAEAGIANCHKAGQAELRVWRVDRGYRGYY
jgi:hypothetical protein